MDKATPTVKREGGKYYLKYTDIYGPVEVITEGTSVPLSPLLFPACLYK